MQRMFERMNVEGPHAWGMLYLVQQFKVQKNELAKLQIKEDILSQL